MNTFARPDRGGLRPARLGREWWFRPGMSVAMVQVIEAWIPYLRPWIAVDGGIATGCGAGVGLKPTTYRLQDGPSLLTRGVTRQPSSWLNLIEPHEALHATPTRTTFDSVSES